MHRQTHASIELKTANQPLSNNTIDIVDCIQGLKDTANEIKNTINTIKEPWLISWFTNTSVKISKESLLLQINQIIDFNVNQITDEHALSKFKGKLEIITNTLNYHSINPKFNVLSKYLYKLSGYMVDIQQYIDDVKLQKEKQSNDDKRLIQEQKNQMTEAMHIINQVQVLNQELLLVQSDPEYIKKILLANEEVKNENQQLKIINAELNDQLLESKDSEQQAREEAEVEKTRADDIAKENEQLENKNNAITTQLKGSQTLIRNINKENVQLKRDKQLKNKIIEEKNSKCQEMSKKFKYISQQYKSLEQKFQKLNNNHKNRMTPEFNRQLTTLKQENRELLDELIREKRRTSQLTSELKASKSQPTKKNYSQPSYGSNTNGLPYASNVNRFTFDDHRIRTSGAGRIRQALYTHTHTF